MTRNKIGISFIKSCVPPVATFRNNDANKLIFFLVFKFFAGLEYVKTSFFLNFSSFHSFVAFCHTKKQNNIRNSQNE